MKTFGMVVMCLALALPAWLFLSMSPLFLFLTDGSQAVVALGIGCAIALARATLRDVALREGPSLFKAVWVLSLIVCLSWFGLWLGVTLNPGSNLPGGIGLFAAPFFWGSVPLLLLAEFAWLVIVTISWLRQRHW